MDSLLIFARGYVIFVAISGFIFGQLFFGNFAIGATLAGIFGLLSGILSGKYALKTRLRSKTIITFCLISMVGVGLDAYNYYAHLNSSGNYYAWFMIGPYLAFLIIIIWRVVKSMPSNKPSKL